MNAVTLPRVDTMMVREFTPTNAGKMFGGILIMDEFDVKEIGLAQARLIYDEPVVDCSHRIFEITTFLMRIKTPFVFGAFPVRRWRNLWEDQPDYRGPTVTELPGENRPLLYIGNPIKIVGHDGRHIGKVTVFRSPEFTIKSGMALGY